LSISERTEVSNRLRAQDDGGAACRHGNRRNYLIEFGAAVILAPIPFEAPSIHFIFGSSVPK
jgi:hypothetical protein